jgi:hypothetical protein
MGKLKEEVKQEVSAEPDASEVVAVDDTNMFKIIGIVDGYYVVKTPRGLKRVKADQSNPKRINDEITIEKL